MGAMSLNGLNDGVSEPWGVVRKGVSESTGLRGHRGTGLGRGGVPGEDQLTA